MIYGIWWNIWLCIRYLSNKKRSVVGNESYIYHLLNNLHYPWVIASNILKIIHFGGLCFLTSRILRCFILCYKSRQQGTIAPMIRLYLLNTYQVRKKHLSCILRATPITAGPIKGRLWIFYNQGVYIGSRRSFSASQTLVFTHNPTPHPHPPLMGRHKHRSMIVWLTQIDCYKCLSLCKGRDGHLWLKSNL